MKKIFNFALIIMLCGIILTGCGTVDTSKINIKDSMDKLYDGIKEDDKPFLETIELTEENMEYNLGTKINIKEGFISQPTNGSVAHSVVLLRVADNVDIEKAKKDIEDNVNPRKWICVEAEKVIVDNKGDLIILIMSDNTLAPKIHENFKKLK